MGSAIEVTVGAEIAQKSGPAAQDARAAIHSSCYSTQLLTSCFAGRIFSCDGVIHGGRLRMNTVTSGRVRNTGPLGWEVRARQDVCYSVQFYDGLFSHANTVLLRAGIGQTPACQRRLIVIDTRVLDLYGWEVEAYFRANRVRYRFLPLDTTEPQKTVDNVLCVVRALNNFGVNRRSDPLIAIGGGVLLDVAGFAASLYRRGLPYVRVPTTLMGLIDAGIGIKTGVNFEAHKNRIGSYFAPQHAYLDTHFLRTLDDRHVANGIAEIIKIAIIKDVRLFELLEENASNLIGDRFCGRAAYREILTRATVGMLDELAGNLWETVLERVVDYGHTFSPTLEMTALPELLHGEAVAIDMALSLVIAAQRDFISERELARALSLIEGFGLPTHHAQCEEALLMKALADTTSHRDGLQRLPLSCGLGRAVFINDLTRAEVCSAARYLAERDRVWLLGKPAAVGEDVRRSAAVSYAI
jgi:3-dehydroquinate synthase